MSLLLLQSSLTLLNVVVGERASILKLLSGEDQSLLIWGDSLLVLDFSFHILDRIGRLDLEGDGLARQSLDEDLHCGKERKILPQQLLLHRQFKEKEIAERAEMNPRILVEMSVDFYLWARSFY